MTNIVHNAPFTLAEINSAIERMAKAQQTSASAIGRVMVMALFAANAGFDGKKTADVANMLMKNLRKGVRKTAVADVLENLGNLAYVSGTFQFFDAGKGWSPDEAKHAKMICSDWESFKKDAPEVQPVDVVEAFDDLVNKLIRAAGKEKVTKGEYLQRLVDLRAAIKGEEFDRTELGSESVAAG